MAEDLYNFIPRYKNRKQEIRTAQYLTLKGNRKIKLNLNNRDLAIKWIEQKEKDLINTNGYNKTAEIRYSKTLYKELTSYLTNILYWFNYKNFQDITKEDIEKVYQGLEKGDLKTTLDHNLSEASRKDYYSRSLKGGFFKFIGKDQLAKEVIKRKFTTSPDVRFFEIDTLRTLVSYKDLKNTYRLAFWLLFDTGIEVNALCQLKKSHFTLENEPNLKPYFIMHVDTDISKKNRKKRDVFINLDEANDLLTKRLNELTDDQKLFDFKPPALYRVLKIIVKKLNLKAIPVNKSITTKDFRSSCCTYLLTQKWTTDEIKGRIGHSVSSTEIDRYVNYLGINQKVLRQKSEEINSRTIRDEYAKQSEVLKKLYIDNKELSQAVQKTQEEMESLKKNLSSLYNIIREVKPEIEQKTGIDYQFPGDPRYPKDLTQEEYEKQNPITMTEEEYEKWFESLSKRAKKEFAKKIKKWKELGVLD